MGEANPKNNEGGGREGGLPPEVLIFGGSLPMVQVRQRLEKVARANIPVLIQGEGGTGKEVLARWIHLQSSVRGGAFVKVSCAAIPGTLLESELFGYEVGAFTGANTRKPGRVELAHRGTLFLDEIAEIEHSFQAKLLQFLQDGRFSKIGDQEDTLVETRTICATNRRLDRELESGRFREDLFYRINGIRVQLPPLRERREDIAPLAEYFFSQFRVRFEKDAPALSAQMLAALQNYDWPGNIRELENRIARYVILGGEEEIAPEERIANASSSSRKVPGKGEGPIPLKQIAKEAVRETERRLIMEVLKANHWNRRKAAQALQISYRALIYKIREVSLKPKNGTEGPEGKHSEPTAIRRSRTDASRELQ